MNDRYPWCTDTLEIILWIGVYEVQGPILRDRASEGHQLNMLGAAEICPLHFCLLLPAFPHSTPPTPRKVLETAMFQHPESQE